MYATVGAPLYRRFFQKPKLRFHKSARLHVLFGPYGPGLQLVGTVQAVNAQQFLSSLEAAVTHEASGEQHTLEWRILFPDAFLQEPGKTPKKDIPVGVMVNPQQAYRFQAFFNDPSIEDGSIREIQARLQKEWVSVLAGVVTRAHHDSPEAIAQLATHAGEVRNDAFRRFMETDTFAWAKAKLQGTFFWKPGMYRLSIQMRTAEPDNVFEQIWRFELSDEHIQTLLFNVEFSLGELAGLPNMIYSGCTVDYFPVPY